MPVPGEKKGKFKSANLNARTKAPERKDKDQRYGGGRLMVLGKGRAPRPGEARTSAHAGPVNTKSLRSEGSSLNSTPSLVPTTGGVRKDENTSSKPETETGFTAEDLEPKYVDNHQFAPTVAPWAKGGSGDSGGVGGTSGGVSGGTGRWGDDDDEDDRPRRSGARGGDVESVHERARYEGLASKKGVSFSLLYFKKHGEAMQHSEAHRIDEPSSVLSLFPETTPC